MDDEKGLIIYNTPDGRSKVALMERDGMVWLNEQSIAELFGTSKQNVSWHISNILKDGELAYDSVVIQGQGRPRSTVPSLGNRTPFRVSGERLYHG